ncbi:hypothetical protein CPC16_006242 [Podila verticillata]|nr:hypothetical protein BGZ59_007416 [Podila verticillata]KAF9388800.1 hypothetical protein CPC16_006242 [Podila verticillata]
MFEKIFKRKASEVEKPLPIRCTIEVHTNQRTGGVNDLPLLVGSPDIPATMGATITLHVDEDCSGNQVEIEFKAWTKTVVDVQVDASECLRTEDPFKINRWKLPVMKPKLDIIAKGRYTKYVEVRIDPTWPSSSTYRQGFVKYAIMVRYKANGRMNEIVAHSEEQEIWVLNSENVPTGGPPTVVTGVVHHESLQVQASIPSAVVAMGQLVPVTVQLSPYLAASKCAGREAVVLGATYKVKQKHRVRCRGFHVGEGVIAYDNCLNFALNEGWPKNKDRWERTVDIRIPSDPAISAYTVTKFLFITHTLTVKLIFQTSSEKDKTYKTEECKLTFDIKVVPPPPSTDAVTMHELPPEYEPKATQPPGY